MSSSSFFAIMNSDITDSKATSASAVIVVISHILKLGQRHFEILFPPFAYSLLSPNALEFILSIFFVF
jgi:hypothetical protein